MPGDEKTYELLQSKSSRSLEKSDIVVVVDGCDSECPVAGETLGETIEEKLFIELEPGLRIRRQDHARERPLILRCLCDYIDMAETARRIGNEWWKKRRKRKAILSNSRSLEDHMQSNRGDEAGHDAWSIEWLVSYPTFCGDISVVYGERLGDIFAIANKSRLGVSKPQFRVTRFSEAVKKVNLPQSARRIIGGRPNVELAFTLRQYRA